jgi:hypothetical protein
MIFSFRARREDDFINQRQEGSFLPPLLKDVSHLPRTTGAVYEVQKILNIFSFFPKEGKIISCFYRHERFFF